MVKVKPEIVMKKTFFGFSIPTKSWRNPLLQKYVFTKRKEGNALDVGCGNRGVLPELANSYSYVVGLDMCLKYPSHYSLKAAKKMVKKCGLQNVDLVLADCQNLPFKESVFASIVCTHVLEHIMKPQKVLEYTKKMMKRGGHFYIEVPWLSELLGPTFSFNPIKQWMKVLMSRGLDDIALGKNSFLSKLLFKIDERSKTVKPRCYLPKQYSARAWYRKTIELKDYVTKFLCGKLLDPHHKHFYTKKEWKQIIESQFKIVVCEGIYNISVVAKV